MRQFGTKPTLKVREKCFTVMAIISKALTIDLKNKEKVCTSGKIQNTRELSKRTQWKVLRVSHSQKKSGTKAGLKTAGVVGRGLIATPMAMSSKDSGVRIKNFMDGIVSLKVHASRVVSNKER